MTRNIYIFFQHGQQILCIFGLWLVVESVGMKGQAGRQLFYRDGQMCGLRLSFSLLNPNLSNFNKVLPAYVF